MSYSAAYPNTMVCLVKSLFRRLVPFPFSQSKLRWICSVSRGFSVTIAAAVDFAAGCRNRSRWRLPQTFPVFMRCLNHPRWRPKQRSDSSIRTGRRQSSHSIPFQRTGLWSDPDGIRRRSSTVPVPGIPRSSSETICRRGTSGCAPSGAIRRVFSF